MVVEKEQTIERNGQDDVGGYPKLSRFMASFPNTAIVRRFADLNMRNILYLQAELVRLEMELDIIAKRDFASIDPSRNGFHESWWTLRSAIPTDRQDRQWRKFLEIRDKLDQYNAALLSQKEILQLSRPRKHELGNLRWWLQSPAYGNMFLHGHEAAVWREENEGDLITLAQVKDDQDPFSRWFSTIFVGRFHRLLGHRMKKSIGGDVESGLTDYGGVGLSTITGFLSVVIAALLPTASILVLYFVTKLLFRLCIVAAFSVIFSASLATFSKARKIEIFAATAAFASVQVVFVSNTNGSPIPPSP